MAHPTLKCSSCNSNSHCRVTSAYLSPYYYCGNCGHSFPIKGLEEEFKKQIETIRALSLLMWEEKDDEDEVLWYQFK